jgi:hypothetical protein
MLPMYCAILLAMIALGGEFEAGELPQDDGPLPMKVEQSIHLPNCAPCITAWGKWRPD